MELHEKREGRGSEGDIAHFVNATADESNQANKQAAAEAEPLCVINVTQNNSRVSRTAMTATDHVYYCGIPAEPYFVYKKSFIMAIV